MAVGQQVYTPLGRGQIVYRLKNGTLLVEFPHGGGEVFRPTQLFTPARQRQRKEHRRAG